MTGTIAALKRQLKSLHPGRAIIVWIDGEPEPEHRPMDMIIRLPDAVNTYD